jgi:hypothetical protein
MMILNNADSYNVDYLLDVRSGLASGTTQLPITKLSGFTT